MTLSKRTRLFGLYSVCLILLNAPVLRVWLEVSMSDSSASHLVIVPLITSVLIYSSRVAVFESVRSAWGPGLSLIGLGLVCWSGAALYGIAVQSESLSFFVAILVLVWLGGFLLCYGQHAFRGALFPLLFLAFMVPMPAFLLSAITRSLTIGSSELVAALFTLTGIPYHRDGFVFSLPMVAIYIADECSGIRSTIALVLTALLAGHVHLKRGWSKVLLVAVILPVTVLKNGIRITTLTLLAVYVDPGYLTGRLHQTGGIVFFALGMAVAVPFFLFLYKRDHSLPADRSPLAPMPARQGL